MFLHFQCLTEDQLTSASHSHIVLNKHVDVPHEMHQGLLVAMSAHVLANNTANSLFVCLVEDSVQDDIDDEAHLSVLSWMRLSLQSLQWLPVYGSFCFFLVCLQPLKVGACGPPRNTLKLSRSAPAVLHHYSFVELLQHLAGFKPST